MTAGLVTDRVTKDFGPVRAVDGVSLAVAPGEVVALLGLNGAGKTTLIRLLLGMVRPTSGRVLVCGRALPAREVWAEVGYLVETPAAYPELTVRENLDVVRRLRRAEPRLVDEALERFGLGEYAARRAGRLSLGNRQRLGLAKALLHRPAVALLDEPVNGLDPAGVVEVRSLVTELAREHGTAVLVSSHLLTEVARAATRIAVLHEGRLVEELEASALERRLRRHLEVATADPVGTARLLGGLGMVPGSAAGRLLVLEDPRAVADPARVAEALVLGGHPPERLAVVEEDLESYFLRLVSGEDGSARAENREVHRVG